MTEISFHRLVNVEKDVEKMDQYFVDVQFFFFLSFWVERCMIFKGKRQRLEGILPPNEKSLVHCWTWWRFVLMKLGLNIEYKCCLSFRPPLG